MFEEYYDEIEHSNISSEDKKVLNDFFELFDKYKYEPDKFDRYVSEYTSEELGHIFQIASFNPKLQIDIWSILPQRVADNEENFGIFENVLENKFREYINGVDKESLARLLNSSRQIKGEVDDKGEPLYWNVALLRQMKSPLFDNLIAREAFSFEQLLEIVSVKDTETTLEAILANSNSRNLLISIARDTENWQAKLQHIINLEDIEREYLINHFGLDGKSIIRQELKRRKERFESMERGYFEDEEDGVTFDCEIDPYNMLLATFGISYVEAKEIMKKYGEDIDKLDIQSNEDWETYRKLQIIKELTIRREFDSYEEGEEFYRNYYYSHREELQKISKNISPFYKVDLESEFVDLYARQYDRALDVQTSQIDSVSYNGKTIPIYEASGDFMVLIRGEHISPDNEQNFWNTAEVHLKGLCQNTISQDYIRTLNYDRDDYCFIASTSCKDGELRMASTTNIKSKEANIALSNLGVQSDFGNGVVFRIPQEQINNSRGTNNETITSRNVYNSEAGLYERKASDYVVYIQDTIDTALEQDERFKTAQFVASQTGWPILIISREKYAQSETAKIQDLKDKLLGNKERSHDETDENIIKELIVKFNNNREGILTSQGLRDKYFTESQHSELVGTINARLSQLASSNPEQYESLVQAVSDIYNDEIAKYYAFSYDRDDAQKELDIDSTREHLKPYEDFLMEHEENIFDLSDNEKDKVFSTIRNISQTPYYEMNQYHSLSHIQKVIMFSGILAQNENLSPEETEILLASAAFHDSGRDGSEGENDNHAVASARQVKEYFEQNPNNSFGITPENISMIQAIIEYHEHQESERGVTDEDKLWNLCGKYNIDYKEFDTLVKLSNLLKDADALDRARFGKRSENRWSLDTRYLKSQTAKSISMLRFSEECNFEFEEREQQENQETSETLATGTVEEILESKLHEFNRIKQPNITAIPTPTEMLEYSEAIQEAERTLIDDLSKDDKPRDSKTKETRLE